MKRYYIALYTLSGFPTNNPYSSIIISLLVVLALILIGFVTYVTYMMATNAEWNRRVSITVSAMTLFIFAPVMFFVYYEILGAIIGIKSPDAEKNLKANQ